MQPRVWSFVGCRDRSKNEGSTICVRLADLLVLFPVFFLLLRSEHSGRCIESVRVASCSSTLLAFFLLVSLGGICKGMGKWRRLVSLASLVNGRMWVRLWCIILGMP